MKRSASSQPVPPEPHRPLRRKRTSGSSTAAGPAHAPPPPPAPLPPAPTRRWLLKTLPPQTSEADTSGENAPARESGPSSTQRVNKVDVKARWSFCSFPTPPFFIITVIISGSRRTLTGEANAGGRPSVRPHRSHSTAGRAQSKSAPPRCSWPPARQRREPGRGSGPKHERGTRASAFVRAAAAGPSFDSSCHKARRRCQACGAARPSSTLARSYGNKRRRQAGGRARGLRQPRTSTAASGGSAAAWERGRSDRPAAHSSQSDSV